MLYITDPKEIVNYILSLKTAAFDFYKTTNQIPTFWVDTETAYWRPPNPNPKVSLIQLLHQSSDTKHDGSIDTLAKQVVIFDVLGLDKTVQIFIDEIMKNEMIRKVFHNSPFDLRFLGKDTAKNVHCTLKVSREMNKDSRYQSVYRPENNQLKTVIGYLRNDIVGDKSGQESDWDNRPLPEEQLKYATLDPIYTMIVDLSQQSLQNRVTLLSSLKTDLEPVRSNIRKVYTISANDLVDIMMNYKMPDGFKVRLPQTLYEIMVKTKIPVDKVVVTEFNTSDSK